MPSGAASPGRLAHGHVRPARRRSSRPAALVAGSRPWRHGVRPAVTSPDLGRRQRSQQQGCGSATHAAAARASMWSASANSRRRHISARGPHERSRPAPATTSLRSSRVKPAAARRSANGDEPRPRPPPAVAAELQAPLPVCRDVLFLRPGRCPAAPRRAASGDEPRSRPPGFDQSGVRRRRRVVRTVRASGAPGRRGRRRPPPTRCRPPRGRRHRCRRRRGRRRGGTAACRALATPSPRP